MGTNDFDNDVRYMMLHDVRYTCWGCGCNHADCLHHIFGRGLKQQPWHASILNAAPMGNHQCHIPKHGHWSSQEGKKELLKKTIERLSDIDYELKDIDMEFLEHYGLEIKRLGIII